MIPLGVLASSHVAPAGGGVTLTYESAPSTAGTSFTGVPIGAAASDRIVLIACSWRAAGTGITPTAVTIGGVTATIDADHQSAIGNTSGVVWAHAVVPTGTSATIVVTFDATVLRSGLTVWSVTGSSSLTLSDSDSTVTHGDSVTVAGPADIVVAATSAFLAVDQSVAWTNATELHDSSIAFNTYYAGAEASTGVAIAADYSASTVQYLLSAIALSAT